MPIEHTVDEKTGIMHVRRWGAITNQDEADALQKRKEDPLVVPDIPVIVDCRDVHPPDKTEVVEYLSKKVVSLAAELNCGPVAIVVSSDVEYGMARMYMALTVLKHPNTKVFRRYDNAMKWLQKQREIAGFSSPGSSSA